MKTPKHIDALYSINNSIALWVRGHQEGNIEDNPMHLAVEGLCDATTLILQSMEDTHVRHDKDA